MVEKYPKKKYYLKLYCGKLNLILPGRSGTASQEILLLLKIIAYG